eukprot:358897-Chlamydomonas_euryale.AAC.5
MRDECCACGGPTASRSRASDRASSSSACVAARARTRARCPSRQRGQYGRSPTLSPPPLLAGATPDVQGHGGAAQRPVTRTVARQAARAVRRVVAAEVHAAARGQARPRRAGSAE